MMKIFFNGLLFLFIGSFLFGQDVLSPSEFLGDDYGKQFTPHHKLVDYFQHVADNSDKVHLQQYGETNEGRPLYLAFVSSVENLEKREEIRQTNLFNAKMRTNAPENINEKSIVWLSYSVHGNEAGGAESSMNVIYKLVTGDSEINQWLEETMVIMDPSLNPDGYSRYSHWVKGISGTKTHPKLDDVEHMEPWPGGRVNHYLFDLNRDWAWQTQVETRQRIIQYNLWMPHVHADLHEMGYDDHYYFAPAAEPFHKAITDWQREFQFEIGKNHAQYFDKNGWLYFTREIFDLLYPSYGDTWPTFNGSIGMTYEQAGHGMSGRSIEMGNGKNLLLQDRIDHHTTTSLSTIETSAKNRKAVVQNFKNYYKESIESPVGEHHHYIVKQGELTDKFTELLSNNGILFQYVDENSSLSGYHFQSKRQESFSAEKGDVYISAFQPKSTLLQVFMEEEPVLADSVTYDITAWSIPMAYQLDCYSLKSKPRVRTIENITKKDTNVKLGTYGIAIKWHHSFDAKKMLSRLLQKGLYIKSIHKTISFDSFVLERGDFVILNIDQKNVKELQTILESASKGLDIHTIALNTGFSVSGSDLGGSGLGKITAPRVLTFFGNGVSANEYGQVWFYFENSIDYPISRVDIQNFSSVKLSDFNTIILPDGYYTLTEKQIKSIDSWVNSGGKLIAISGALRNLKSNKSFALGKIVEDNDESKDAMEVQRKEQAKRDRFRKYEGAERRSISGSIPGAVFKTDIDTSHPLCYGMKHYYTLKNSSANYPLLESGCFNPVRIPENYISYGFVGAKLKNSFADNFVFAVESKGSGTVIYMADNPLFRAFWKSGEIIFANALFQVQ